MRAFGVQALRLAALAGIGARRRCSVLAAVQGALPLLLIARFGVLIARLG